jgi:spore coat protein CotH
MILLLLSLACSPAIPLLAQPSDVADDSAGSAGGGGDLVPDDEVEELPGVATDSDILFQDDLIQEFYLEISDESLDDLARDPYEYTEATLVFQGVSYGPIAIRTKGENSWRPFREKSSFKLDFNRYDGGPDRFLGMKGLTFQGMNEDYTMMHERVAYRMYREAGVPAARANHAIVYVNDELYGLFTVIDTVDDVFLKRWYDDASGSMWEQHDGDLTDQYVQNNTYFQHEEGEDDRWPLQALADALESSGDEAYEAADGIIDWDQFHRYWAASSIVMNFDAYPMRFAGDDCHVYFDVESERIHYFPHGVDESFYYDENFETRANGHISAKCRESQACRDAWANRVYDVLEISEDIDLHAYAEYVRDQIEEHAEADPERNYSMSDVRQQQNYMLSRIENRRSSVRGHIGARPD